MNNDPLVKRDSSGRNRHNKLHTCDSPTSNCSYTLHDYWPLDDNEIIKFAAKIYDTKGKDNGRKAVVKLYKSAWKRNNMPGNAPQIGRVNDDISRPMDLSLNSEYPCPRAVWFPEYVRRSGYVPSSLPPIIHAPSADPQPSTSGQVPQSESPLTATSQPEISSSPHSSPKLPISVQGPHSNSFFSSPLRDHLRKYRYPEVKTGEQHRPQIPKGLVPGCSDWEKSLKPDELNKKNGLTVLFILTSPHLSLGEQRDDKPERYSTERQIELRLYELLKMADKGSIVKNSDPYEYDGKEYIKAFYNNWVSISDT